jgi:hypothetical protein
LRKDGHFESIHIQNDILYDAKLISEIQKQKVIDARAVSCVESKYLTIESYGIIGARSSIRTSKKPYIRRSVKTELLDNVVLV